MKREERKAILPPSCPTPRSSLFALRSSAIAAAGMLMVVMVPASAHGQAAWYEGFEGPETSWHDAGGDARYRVQRHQRMYGQAHTGDGCERLVLLGNHGTYVHISHEVGRPRVIDELLPTVWVKSDRPGLQIAARVVLPRTADPRTGRPVSTLVRGSSYTKVGRWEQLRIADVPLLLARQIRLLRAELGPSVDGREAYVDRILLNIYGGPGTTNVWIDDLDIAGYVGSQDVSTVARGAGRSSSGGSAPAGRPTRRAVELVGSVLLVEGRPLFPRIIQYQGEPLALLKQLGFNAVWLGRSASAELLEEAGRASLWLVCPPPQPSSPYARGGSVGALDEIGPQYDRVLVWDLGRGLSPEQLESTRSWAEQVRRADRRQARPRICFPDGDLLSYSRIVDLLLIGRRPLGTSLELTDYGRWIRRQPLLARPGTTIWTTIQTQPSAALAEQLRALDPNQPPPRSVSSEQIRLLAYAAVSAGSRGLLFESHSPLDASDPDSRHRAMALELLNLELQLIEPWAAGASLVTAVAGSEPELVSAVLRGNRSRLLLPTWLARGAQFTAGRSAGDRVSLVVPGVPEDAKAYRVSPGALQPLWPKRVPGGTRVRLEEFGLTGQVLFSQDRLAIDHLSRRSAEIGPRAARLWRDLAARRLHLVQQVTDRIARIGGTGVSPVAAVAAFSSDGRAKHVPANGWARWLQTARTNLQSCDGYLAARDHQAATLHARRAFGALRQVERAHWEMAVERLTSPVASPGTVSFATLPWHLRLADRIAGGRLGSNRLSGADFEDLPTMLAAGWNHFQGPSPGLQTAADLIAEAAHSGFRGLRLIAGVDDPENPPAVIETPPLWITSPPVPVEAGQIVCIRGWAQIPKAITGSVDGLLIVDSLSGEALAERIGQTSGWQQFILYRVAPRSGQMTVTFALSGLGEVRLDDVTIQVLEPSSAGRTTQRAPLGRLLLR